jgi:hypothetical protein
MEELTATTKSFKTKQHGSVISGTSMSLVSTSGSSFIVG